VFIGSFKALMENASNLDKFISNEISIRNTKGEEEASHVPILKWLVV